jgi:3-phenylpropionate/trans-cinnamate dioxygenase ferredoxin reductase component
MKVVIIGNGIAGVSAAISIRKNSDAEICLISSESIDFFSRTALMYIYMGHMRLKDTQPYSKQFWEKNKIERVKDLVTSIDFNSKMLTTEANGSMAYDKLILALGSNYNLFDWPGQNLEGVRGLYHLQDLQYLELETPRIQRAVVVGGGLIGIELAEMLHSRNIPVTLLVRENAYWDNMLPLEEAEMVSRHIRKHGIDLRLNTELKEIVDDGNGRACAVIDSEGNRIDCQYVGLTAGVHPNINLVKNTQLETDRGILVDEYLSTNMDDVFAIGDCAQLRDPPEGRRNIEAVWYVGRMMGQTVGRTIAKSPTAYNPGIWFNSAKFLDIEYQVYGNVPNLIPDHMHSFYWEHPEGEKSIRINYDKESRAVLGFNLMGIRYRQDVCQKWINDKKTVESVLSELSLANFDPEFYRVYESDMIKTFESQSGKSIQGKSLRSWDRVFTFLNKN